MGLFCECEPRVYSITDGDDDHVTEVAFDELANNNH